MKTNVSIKFSSIEEYREIEKKLEELGYVNDKEWNERHLDNSFTKGYCFIEYPNFAIFDFTDYDDQKVYNSLEEFLEDQGMKTFNEWIEHERKLKEENIKYDWNIYCQYGLSVGSGTMGNLIEVIKNKTKKEEKI